MFLTPEVIVGSFSRAVSLTGMFKSSPRQFTRDLFTITCRNPQQHHIELNLHCTIHPFTYLILYIHFYIPIQSNTVIINQPLQWRKGSTCKAVHKHSASVRFPNEKTSRHQFPCVMRNKTSLIRQNLRQRSKLYRRGTKHQQKTCNFDFKQPAAS